MSKKGEPYKMYKVFEYYDDGSVSKHRYKELIYAMEEARFLVGDLGKYNKISKSTSVKVEFYEKDGTLVREWTR